MSWPPDKTRPERLVGERVVLRPYREGDAPALYEAVAESIDRLRYWFPWANREMSLEASEKTVEFLASSYAEGTDLTMGIWNHDETRLLGGSGLHRLDFHIGLCEIGYWIRSSEEGKGLVSECVRLLEAAAFNDLGMNTVHIRLVPNNVRSRAVAERCGYLYEATVRNYTLLGDGSLSSLAFFSKTKQEWLDK